MRFSLRTAILGSLTLGLLLADVAGATAPGACRRKRNPPNQNLFWDCVAEGSSCGTGNSCQTIAYGGIVPYSTCECLPAVHNPDDFSYGTGGLWTAVVVSGAPVPVPGSSVTFALAPGINALVIYPNVDINAGQITNAQEFADNSAFTGSMTMEIGASTSADSFEVHVSGLTLAVASFDFEGNPTGPTSITLAPDGGTATGLFDVASSTIQFDEPVHCLATNGLMGNFDYFFRPVLIEGAAGKAGFANGFNPFSVFTTGTFVPPQIVSIEQRHWSDIKRLYR
jgi:hypothetical protein